MEEPKKNIVSFSQFDLYSRCPHRWKLDYADGKRIKEENLILSFGHSIHRTVQEYLKILYKDGGFMKAMTFDLKGYFSKDFLKEIEEKKIKAEDEDIQEFLDDGLNILTEFTSNDVRFRYFPKDEYTLEGVESKLDFPILHNTRFFGFIDIVLKNKKSGRVRIIDIKTSTRGWNKYQKADSIKTSQVLLYKALYSQKYDIPVDKIDVEFLILKRKLYENSYYRQSRFDQFVPDNSIMDVGNTLDKFTEFVTECFTPEGDYNFNRAYPKVPGKNKKNCTYCPHKGINCDGVASK